MKAFYTSVNRYGNSILYRGYNDKGVAVNERIKFEPTFYLKSNKPTEFLTALCSWALFENQFCLFHEYLYSGIFF